MDIDAVWHTQSLRTLCWIEKRDKTFSPTCDDCFCLNVKWRRCAKRPEKYFIPCSTSSSFIFACELWTRLRVKTLLWMAKTMPYDFFLFVYLKSIWCSLAKVAALEFHGQNFFGASAMTIEKSNRFSCDWDQNCQRKRNNNSSIRPLRKSGEMKRFTLRLLHRIKFKTVRNYQTFRISSSLTTEITFHFQFAYYVKHSLSHTHTPGLSVLPSSVYKMARESLVVRRARWLLCVCVHSLDLHKTRGDATHPVKN